MEFVSFEIAKKLKEKGIDYPCVGHYVNNNLFICHYINAFHSDKDESIDVPTISQVLKWLREEKKIFIHIDVYENDKFDYFFGIAVQGDETWDMKYVGEEDYKSYELAAIAGIEYVLDNLI